MKFLRPDEKLMPFPLIHEIYRSCLPRRVSRLLCASVCLTSASESNVRSVEGESTAWNLSLNELARPIRVWHPP